FAALRSMNPRSIGRSRDLYVSVINPLSKKSCNFELFFAEPLSKFPERASRISLISGVEASWLVYQFQKGIDCGVFRATCFSSPGAIENISEMPPELI